MSWTRYIADKENKLLIDIGKVDKEEVEELLKKWDDIIQEVELNGDILETKLKGLTLRQFSVLTNIFDTLHQIIFSGVKWQGLLYLWSEGSVDWDVINEDETKKYVKEGYEFRR